MSAKRGRRFHYHTGDWIWIPYARPCHKHDGRTDCMGCIRRGWWLLLGRTP